jgi:hypothetical protein
MRMIHISNENNRDASVSFESRTRGSNVRFVLKGGREKRNIKILKSTADQSIEMLLKKYGTILDVADKIIESDPEIDAEKAGMILDNTKKLFVTENFDILYGVDLYEVVKNPDGTEKKREFLQKTRANINSEHPVRLTGKLIKKEEAAGKFVFSIKYQIKHVNGLTYDFLYDIAKNLDESKSLMLLSAGEKGTEPLILYEGGVPYRGFLEGRTAGKKYCLILHLTNLELKEFVS